MQITNSNKLAGVCLIAAFSIGGLFACNSNDHRSSDNNNADADTVAISNNNNSTATADKGASKDTTVATATKKKRRASIMMPAGNSDMSPQSAMMKDKEGVYNKVQVMPEFPGGQDALASYVNNHIEYPQQAIDNNTTGTVRVSFVIDEKGKVTDTRLLNGNGNKLGNGLDEEALRVINNMPAWKPGKVHGKSVKTRLELPITFQFES